MMVRFCIVSNCSTANICSIDWNCWCRRSWTSTVSLGISIWCVILTNAKTARKKLPCGCVQNVGYGFFLRCQTYYARHANRLRFSHVVRLCVCVCICVCAVYVKCQPNIYLHTDILLVFYLHWPVDPDVVSIAYLAVIHIYDVTFLLNVYGMKMISGTVSLLAIAHPNKNKQSERQWRRDGRARKNERKKTTKTVYFA